MRVAYVRVSSLEQNEARQVEALKSYDIEKWFIEKITGKDTNRPKYQECMEYVREGDTLYVSEWSRLSRSTMDLLNTINELNTKGVKVVSLKENFDTSTPQGKLILTVFAAIAEFERELILQRQAEGIALAKEKGVYKGRAPKKYDEEVLRECLVGIAAGTVSVSEAARRLNVTRATVYNLIKRMGTDTVK